MAMEAVDLARVVDALEALRQEVARLSQRIAALEGVEAPVVGLSEEQILVIAAAVAAFLGKNAPIRQIRLLRTSAWAQQGRITIQASHAL